MNQDNEPHLTSPDGDDAMNIRKVHGGIMRELPDPVELYRRVPWWLRHTYIAMAISLLFYLIVLAGDYDWNVFELPLEKLNIWSEPAEK